MGERLKWLRTSRGLRQMDVIQGTGVSRSVYLNLEMGLTDHVESAVADKLMVFYGVSEETLLDEYNRFLYRGQGGTILELRRNARMGKKAFAKHLGVSSSSLKAWETEEVRVSKRSWGRHFGEKPLGL